jgi:iron complex transport system ATP-binding protein
MLNVRHVSAGYGRGDILHGVDLEVERGEIAGVIGPNGCGKTTLLRVISGALRPRAGTVAIDGIDIATMSSGDIARRIAVVSQHASLPDGFDSFQTALMGRSPHLRLLQSESARDVAVVREAMERTDCWRLRDRTIDQLSGGERQRVLIARALAQEPDLLLLDEPTSNLDIQHQVDTFRLVASLCREQQLAVLAVVHDLTLAGTFADRIAVMSEGRIVADGHPDEVIDEPMIERVYGLAVRVLAHPVTGRPIVAPDAYATRRVMALAGEVTHE